MMDSFRISLTGAFGYPIDENPSPVMYEAGYADLGLKWRYQLFEVKPEGLLAAIEAIRAMHFEGINLTIPHKVAAVVYMDELTESAKVIGAINTIVNRCGKLIGDNTDGKGFVIGMQKNGVELAGKRIVVLGSGGAARAISVECALAGCAFVSIIARNESKGRELRKLVSGATSADSEYIKWIPGVHIPSCDILINATNIGLYPDKNKPDICYEDICKAMIVQDIIPNPAITPFLVAAKERGAIVYDGLNMLIFQGALATKMWTGQMPSPEAMRRALAAAFSKAD